MDLYLMAEQAIMAAGMSLSEAMAGHERSGFYLEETKTAIATADLALQEITARAG